MLAGRGGKGRGRTYTPVVDPDVVGNWFEADAITAYDLGAVAAPAACAVGVVGGVGGEPAVVRAWLEGGGVVEDGDVYGGERFCGVGGWLREGGAAEAKEGGEEGGELHDGWCLVEQIGFGK